MSLFKHIRLKTATILMAFAFMVASTGQSFAQDTTAVQTEDVVASDSAELSTVTEASGDSAALETVASATTTSTKAVATIEPEKEIDPQVYKNFFYSVLIVLLIAIVIAIIGKVISIYEMTTKINGRFNPLAGNNFQANLMLLALPVFLYGVYWSYVNHGAMAWKPAATEHGAAVDTMFIITTIIITIVLVIVHILLFYFSYAYRARLNKKAYFYPHNNTLERIWTIVPAVVLAILVLFGFFTWRKITNVPEELRNSAIQIEVLGEQFAWTVRYPGNDGEFGKRDYRLTTPLNSYGIDYNDVASHDDLLGGEIVIPINQSVRFHIISKDILHSFYIPDFRVQINAVPGMTTYFQFTPTITTEEMREKLGDPNFDFVMLCNKICGAAHYNMQKKVRVVSQKEYEEWLANLTFFYTEDLQKEFAAKNSTSDQELVLDSTSNITAFTNL